MEIEKIDVMLDAIDSSGKHAAQIVTNMLSFARRDEGKKIEVEMGDLVQETLSLARRDHSLKKGYDFRQVTVAIHQEHEELLVACQPSMIQQVLLNIFRNGAEAMGEAGTPDPRFDISLALHEGFVRVSINDNGPGMNMTTQLRVFEPFFTTKDPGKGTGLGLSVSYFIITETHHGTIEVESTPGNGACFTVKLPALHTTSGL